MTDDDFDEYGPSKTSLKKDAEKAQILGQQLLAFNDDFLLSLNLDEALLDAIQLAKKIKHNSGKKRQLQLIGKLMRRVDLRPIEEAIARVYQAKKDDRNKHHQAERLRDSLIKEGESSVERLLGEHPKPIKNSLKSLLKELKHYTEGTPAYKKAYRSLFRQLFELPDY